jgi:hypothetical protein
LASEMYQGICNEDQGFLHVLTHTRVRQLRSIPITQDLLRLAQAYFHFMPCVVRSISRNIGRLRRHGKGPKEKPQKRV